MVNGATDVLKEYPNHAEVKGWMENAKRIEELVTLARQSDSELARVREGATYAGDPDPYRKPGNDDDEDE